MLRALSALLEVICVLSLLLLLSLLLFTFLWAWILQYNVRNVIIFFFYKQKTWWNSDIWNFFGEKFNFGLYFIDNRQFGQIDSNDVIVTSYMVCLYCLVCMESRDPSLYHGTKLAYLRRLFFKFTGGLQHPPWFSRCIAKNSLVRVAPKCLL